MQRHVSVGGVTFGNDLPFVLIAGPCQLESRDHAFECAAALIEMTAAASVGLVYKTSFDKANRSSIKSPRGVGFSKAIDIFADLRATLGVTLLTDVHDATQCAPIADVVDILQIPAFLSRQTDLLCAAGSTGAVVNIKKGPFMAPSDIANAAAKVASAGNDRVLLTERGVSFGYHNLVVDMRALPIMAETGYPIIFDVTHSVQQPGSEGCSSGGDRRMAPVLARAATAVGVSGLFVETHPDPDRAPSDGANMLPLKSMPRFIAEISAFDRLTKRRFLVDDSACWR